MAVVLKLNRGATYGTLNLNDQTNYKVLDTYLPRVATRRVSQYGGELYNDVLESIPLYIKGTTTAIVLEKLEDIIAALEQAHAQRLGAVVDPVLLEYLPHGTSLAASVKAPVLGTPLDAQNLYEMAQFGMYMAGNSWETIINLPVVRKGLWKGAAETPAASSGVPSLDPMTVTFADSVRLPSPFKITIATADTHPVSQTGYKGCLFFADQADKILFLDTTLMTPITGTWDSVSNAGAQGGFFRKTTSFSGAQTLRETTLTPNSTARMWDIWGSVYNFSADTDWQVYCTGRGANTPRARTRTTILKSGTANYPALHYFGFVSLAEPLAEFVLWATAGAGAATGDELGVDYFILVAHDEFTGVVPFDTTTGTDGTAATAYFVDDFIVNDRSLTHPEPVATIQNFIQRQEANLRFYNVGDELTALIAGTFPSGSSFTIDPAFDYTLTATRRPGYLVVR